MGRGRSEAQRHATLADRYAAGKEFQPKTTISCQRTTGPSRIHNTIKISSGVSTPAMRLFVRTEKFRGRSKQLLLLTAVDKQRIRRGFPPNDSLYIATRKAYDSVCSLSIDSHYRSCKSGVGRPQKRDD